MIDLTTKNGSTGIMYFTNQNNKHCNDKYLIQINRKAFLSKYGVDINNYFTTVHTATAREDEYRFQQYFSKNNPVAGWHILENFFKVVLNEDICVNPELVKIPELKEYLLKNSVAPKGKEELINNVKVEEVVIKRRNAQQQADFRKRVLENCNYRCVVTGTKVLEVLEAAHLQDVCNGGKYATDNGIMLRKDLHALFDRGLLMINPENMQVIIAKEIREDYKDLHGRTIAKTVVPLNKECLYKKAFNLLAK